MARGWCASLQRTRGLASGERVQVLIAVAAKIGGRSQSPHWRRIRPGPDRWSLRVALVPGARLEIAKLFFLHLVELRVELMLWPTRWRPGPQMIGRFSRPRMSQAVST